ncbi:MAG TPA: hypothetical protein VLJ37_08240 [bacterium]|nr:hypothetical protein [bacterium]
MKKLFVLFLFAAAGFGCTYAKTSPAQLRDMQLQPEAGQETLPEAVTDEAGDTIVPENTSPEVAGTPTETDTPSDTDTPTEDEGADSHCPTGWVSQGNPYLCCRIGDPQTCMFVDPGPGGGDKPTVGGILPVDGEIVVDPTPPDEPTPPPPPGGGSSGGGYDGSNGIGCHFQGPTGGRRMRQTVGTHNEADDILSQNNCVML